MAINDSILEKIDELDITEQDKQLLKDLLKYQEHAGYQYTKQYTDIINRYLGSTRK